MGSTALRQRTDHSGLCRPRHRVEALGPLHNVRTQPQKWAEEDPEKGGPSARRGRGAPGCFSEACPAAGRLSPVPHQHLLLSNVTSENVSR